MEFLQTTIFPTHFAFKRDGLDKTSSTFLNRVRFNANLKALATIPYFNFHFFSHLLIFLQFRDPSYVMY